MATGEYKNITIDDVVSAIKILRDGIVTDENLSTVVGVVDKMKSLLLSIYRKANKVYDGTTVDASVVAMAKARGLEKELISVLNGFNAKRGSAGWRELRELIGNEKWEDTGARSISIDGFLDALMFLRDHMSQADDILSDVYKLFEAVKTVEWFGGSLGSKEEDAYREQLVNSI
ncbi:MAG: hypothetical protein GY861_28640 [bacterium]|nr:hypothetical protein [bacterium]